MTPLSILASLADRAAKKALFAPKGRRRDAHRLAVHLRACQLRQECREAKERHDATR